MRRLIVIALLVVGCDGQATATALSTTTYPVRWSTEGECDVETHADPVDPFGQVPYMMELPAGWLALPPSCVTPLSDYRVIPVPGRETAKIVVWPPVATEKSREQVYAEIEANGRRPLPSGMKPWVVAPVYRRVDLPLGPALEITYTSPAEGVYRAGQNLQYSLWMDGQLFTFGFDAEPVEFAALEPTFRALLETMRLKATSNPSPPGSGPGSAIPSCAASRTGVGRAMATWSRHCPEDRRRWPPIRLTSSSETRRAP